MEYYFFPWRTLSFWFIQHLLVDHVISTLLGLAHFLLAIYVPFLFFSIVVSNVLEKLFVYKPYNCVLQLHQFSLGLEWSQFSARWSLRDYVNLWRSILSVDDKWSSLLLHASSGCLHVFMRWLSSFRTLLCWHLWCYIYCTAAQPLPHDDRYKNIKKMSISYCMIKQTGV